MTRKIKDIPLDERPREKLLSKGVESLSDSELLAIIISSGTKSKSAIEIANDLIIKYGGIDNLFKQNFYELTNIHGISKVKAITMLTIRELYVRISIKSLSRNSSKIQFNGPLDVYNYIHYRYETQLNERQTVFFLNNKNCLISEDIISIGNDTKALNNNRLICKMAIEKYAKKVIITHNHLSGNCNPSIEDIASFISLKNALSFVQVKLIDHIVIGNNEYYSIDKEQKYVI